MPAAKPQQPLGPISHLGLDLASREEVDAVADEAEKEGLLKFGPTFLNRYAGYLCIISDPDGHMVELFSCPGSGETTRSLKFSNPGGLTHEDDPAMQETVSLAAVGLWRVCLTTFFFNPFFNVLVDSLFLRADATYMST